MREPRARASPGASGTPDNSELARLIGRGHAFPAPETPAGVITLLVAVYRRAIIYPPDGAATGDHLQAALASAAYVFVLMLEAS